MMGVLGTFLHTKVVISHINLKRVKFARITMSPPSGASNQNRQILTPRSVSGNHDGDGMIGEGPDADDGPESRYTQLFAQLPARARKGRSKFQII